MKLRQKLLASTAAAVLALGVLSPTATAQTHSSAEVEYWINYTQGLGNLSSSIAETENPVATSSVFALTLGWFGWCLSSNVVNEGSCYF